MILNKTDKINYNNTNKSTITISFMHNNRGSTINSNYENYNHNAPNYYLNC